MMLSVLINDLEESPHKYNQHAPIILHEILLLLDEHAIAYPDDGYWKLVKLPRFRKVRYLPALSLIPGTHHGSTHHSKMLGKLYKCSGFLDIEEGDVVVDVGAYVGGFTMFASEVAQHVIAIEPNETSGDVLTSNLEDYKNVTVVPKAAWYRKEKLEINKSSSPSENSILRPDTRSINQSYEVNANTVPNIVREFGFNRIDYLKIEAEGVEPEILRGALNDTMTIRKIAVDASPERDGEDTVTEICDILERYGYSFKIKEGEVWWGEYIVFGRE